MSDLEVVEVTEGYWRLETEEGVIDDMFYSPVDFGMSIKPEHTIIKCPPSYLLFIEDKWKNLLKANGYEGM